MTAWAQGTFRIGENTRSGRRDGDARFQRDGRFRPATRAISSEGIRNLPLAQFRRAMLSALAAGRGDDFFGRHLGIRAIGAHRAERPASSQPT